MKVLITGAKGYIAQSLMKALNEKYDITGISRDDFDLTNYEATCKFLEGKYFDIVIHTAVVGGNRLKEEDDTIIRQNLDMYYNLINNKECFGRFISFGSGAELDWPTTPYGYSKRIIAESMSKKDYCLNIRVFAVFDENELDRRFIKSNILRYINNQDMLVHENKLMDFFYMKDLTNLVRHYIQQPDWSSKVIDCKYVQSYTLCEIANMINNLDAYKVNIDVGNMQGKPYVGEYKTMPIEVIGLDTAVQQVYNILKNKYE